MLKPTSDTYGRCELPTRATHSRDEFDGQSRDLPRLRGGLLLIPFAVLGLACGSPYPPPPETAREPVVDTLHGVVFTDPYRWLEDQDSPETRAWIAGQNAYAEQIVGESELRTGLEARLRELLEAPGPVYPQRQGEFEYFSFRKAGREVGAIYRRPAPEEPDDGPFDVTADYEVVIDPLDLRADGTTSVAIQAMESNSSWTWAPGVDPADTVGIRPPGRALMAYSIRDGGRDEVEIRIRDLVTGEDLPDRLPTALYSSVSFADDGSVLYYVRRSRRTGPRVYRHVVGTDLSEDVELFGAGIGPTAFVRARFRRGGFPHLHGAARLGAHRRLPSRRAGAHGTGSAGGRGAGPLSAPLDGGRDLPAHQPGCAPEPGGGREAGGPGSRPVARGHPGGRGSADRISVHRRRHLRRLSARREQPHRALRPGRRAEGRDPHPRASCGDAPQPWTTALLCCLSPRSSLPRPSSQLDVDYAWRRRNGGPPPCPSTAAPTR